MDTGAWFASVVPSDPDHTAAAQWLGQNRTRLVTSDYVVDETLTLLRSRGHPRRGLTIGDRLFTGGYARIRFLIEDEITLAWETFRRFSDKDWSFTDCTSKVIIEKLGLTQAFAFDQHFRQFGSVDVVL